jgi:hypothetical protein
MCTTRIHNTSLRASLGYSAKPLYHIFKTHHFSGTQIRYVIRHFAMNHDQDKTQEEWQKLIGPCPSVRNLLRKLFSIRSRKTIQKQLENMFCIRVDI